jgi:hypothetical protein
MADTTQQEPGLWAKFTAWIDGTNVPDSLKATPNPDTWGISQLTDKPLPLETLTPDAAATQEVAKQPWAKQLDDWLGKVFGGLWSTIKWILIAAVVILVGYVLLSVMSFIPKRR